ncbi:MAG: RNA polymerase sigma factor [Nannocystaceae bacterium]|nr:RNA polymerase sigma factor [Nannocystaceae bacterium]
MGSPSDTLDTTEIFERHYDFVFRSLAHLGVPRAVVDDATQDVFIVVHRRLEDYLRDMPMRAWLYGIARRVAYRYRKQAEKHRRRPDFGGGELVSPDELVANRQAATTVSTFLHNQPPEQREVFVLAELEGLSGPEIAAAVGVNLNTVYSRLRLSRRQFARVVKRSRAQSLREMRHA